MFLALICRRFHRYGALIQALLSRAYMYLSVSYRLSCLFRNYAFSCIL